MRRTVTFSVAAALAILLIGFALLRSGLRVQGRPIGYWIHHLSRTDPEFGEACAAIREIGPQAVPYLIKALQSHESLGQRMLRQNWDMLPSWAQKHLEKPPSPNAIKIKGAEGLKVIGPEAGAAVPVLTALLQGRDTAVRAACLEALGEIKAQAAIPALLEVFKEKEAHFRLLAGKGLWATWIANRNDPTAELSRLLQHPHPYFRLGSAECFLAMNRSVAELAQRTFQELMKSEDLTLRHAAAEGSIRAGAEGEPASRAVLILLNHPVAGIRDEAFETAEELGLEPPALRTRLVELLGDPNPDIRSRSIRALGRSERDKAEIVSAISPFVREKIFGVRFAALLALRQLGMPDQKLVPDLIRIVRNEIPLLQGSAIHLLGLLGPYAREAVPALREALVTSTNRSTHAETASALGKIGTAASEAAPDLLHFLHDRNAGLEVQISAAEALCQILPDRKPEAIAALNGALQGQNPARFRVQAAVALMNLGYAGPEVKEALTEVFDGTDPYARLRAAAALLRLSPPDPRALDALTESLRAASEPSNVQLAAQLLAQSGPAAKAALPALTNALSHTNRFVRLAVRQAMKQITSQP